MLVFAVPAQAAGSPTSLAALGDSLTAGYGSNGTLIDAPAYSWSTGNNAGVQSHYLRLVALDAATTGHASNLAVDGSKMSNLVSQAASAAALHPQYVTVWAGTNDACASSVSQMTSVASFKSSLQSVLSQLTTSAPGASILVASVPDWYGLWQRVHTTAAAQAAWTSTGRCPDVLATATSDADRQTVAQRIRDYNAAIVATCAAVAGCFTDGGAIFALWSALGQADLASDWFHLSPVGEAKVAAATWGATPWGSVSSGGGTFGAAAPGTSSGTPGAGYKFGGPYALAAAGTATRFEFYARGGSAAQSFVPAIYRSSGSAPSTLVVAGPPVTVAAGQAPGWVSAAVPSTALSAGTYYLVLQSKDASSQASIYFDSAPTSEGVFNQDAGATPSGTFGTASTEARRWSYRVVLGSGGGGSVPVVVSAPTVSGPAVVGQTLSTTPGTWSGSPTSFTYGWRRCDTGGDNCATIGAAASSTYVVQTADVGFTLRSRVTATNGAGPGAPADSPPTGAVTAAGGSSSFGASLPGSSSGAPGSGYKFGGPYALPAAGTATRFEFYARGGSSAQSFVPAIYRSSGSAPSTLVVAGPLVTVGAGQAAGWVSVPLVSTPLPAGTYYLVLQSKETARSASVYFDTASTNEGVFNQDAGSAPSSSFGTASTEARRWSYRVVLG
jgi:lysophospholipase L1-like esterase